MYHPSRGGVRGGRDQFNWDDVKADKHRENYLGHSLKAPVGRWQKGKDLTWYARDAKQAPDEAAASARQEIERVKQEEEEAMQEALASRQENKPRVNRLNKWEQEDLFKRNKALEEVDKPYARGHRVQGLGFAPSTKSEAPSKKELLPHQAAAEEDRPLARVIFQADIKEATKMDQKLAIDAVTDDSQQVLDEIDKKRKRKEEKRAAKDQQREKKKAAKKFRREKRRRRTSTSSDELVDRKGSRAKHRCHEGDSNEEEHGQTEQEKMQKQNL